MRDYKPYHWWGFFICSSWLTTLSLSSIFDAHKPMGDTKMNKQDFVNTKWDVRDWTPEIKRKWQEKMFDFGFCWAGGFRSVMNTETSYYFVHEDGFITHSVRRDIFNDHANLERNYSFAFPETEQGQSNTATPTASDLLSQGAEILNQRGAEYEKDGNQERSLIASRRRLMLSLAKT